VEETSSQSKSESTSMGPPENNKIQPSSREISSSELSGVQEESLQNNDISIAGSGSMDQPTQTEVIVVDAIAKIMSQIELLIGDIHSLQQGFDSKIKYDASKERIIDSLHSELQTYREGLHFKIMRPLFFDLIAMHDDLTNLLKYHINNENDSEMVVKLLKSLTSFQDTIEGILEGHGVAAFNEPGDQFVPQRQRALRAEITDDPTKDRLIYEHLRKGFEYEGKVLRPESVSVYKFTAPSSPDNAPKEAQP
jgi:molecular chaperone GrpE